MACAALCMVAIIRRSEPKSLFRPAESIRCADGSRWTTCVPPPKLLKTPRSPGLLPGKTSRGKVVLIEAPAIDRFNVETPIASHFERGKTTTLELTVDGRRMYFQIIGQFFHRQNPAVIVLHPSNVLPD